ncbi:MAG: GspE/PulE family protein [Planctomycetota bacterium]|nr:type II/IV secretion system protein [Planctomycetaceae bacterium]MDQ3332182.1 GspE/PulE family protein [Planctomycetota bacterium]
MSTPERTQPTPPAAEAGDNGQKALRAELAELADVVTPASLIDLLLERAFQLNATDIHLDPVADGLRVRLRVDGLLHDVALLPESVRQNVISRLKLLADMDLTERRHSRDGHIARTTFGGERDIRVGTAPTIYGERVVLRLMPDSQTYNSLDDLGLEPEQHELLEKQLRKPYGMIIVAGPVGSGKSTTLYGCLDRLNEPSRSLTTIEDPVERRIDGINQIQVEPKVGFGFVEALRGVLRQDPNVLMVGEIRDSETAHIACRAGLTGVMVLSTIHANDAASAIDVLREYGIPPMFIADAVHCVISQRLIRKVCTQSRETYSPSEAEAQTLGLTPEEAEKASLVRGVPSEANFRTGYAGRTAVFEIMPVDKDIRRAILREAPQSEIASIAKNSGMKTLQMATRDKVLAGVTSTDEMHRVVLSM